MTPPAPTRGGAPGGAPGGTGRPTAAPELRRLLLWMVLATVALHAVAIALHTALDVGDWPAGRQKAFTAGWMVASLLVVLPFMARIRAARLRARHARRTGR